MLSKFSERLNGFRLLAMLGMSDSFPMLPPHFTKAAYVSWGWRWVNRSRNFSDGNKFIAIILRPFVLVLLSASSVSSLIIKYQWGGLDKNLQSAILTFIPIASLIVLAVNTVLTWSPPELLYPRDRLQQTLLYEELQKFICGVEKYKDLDEENQCKLFAVSIVALHKSQILEWYDRTPSTPMPGSRGNPGGAVDQR